MSVFSANSYDITGYDTDNTYLKYGIQRYNLPLVNASMPDHSDKPYDGIILRHVLEHILSPREFLFKIRDLLQPRGKLYVEVPGLLAILDGKYRFNLLEYFVIEHVTLFCLKTLTGLLNTAGFKLVEGNEHVFAIYEPSGCAKASLKWVPEIPPIINQLSAAEELYRKNYIHYKIAELLGSAKQVLVRTNHLFTRMKNRVKVGRRKHPNAS